MTKAIVSPPSKWVMQQAIIWPTNACVLDFAAGSGRHSRALIALSDSQFKVLAVDQDEVALTELTTACPTVKTHCQDLESEEAWQFASQQFDVVLVTNYLYRPKLAMLFDLVRPGGHLVYETFGVGNEALGKPSNPNFLLEPGELSAAMPANFILRDYFHGRVDQPKPAIIQRLAAERIV
jgi:SAM-dependent methyltransferase